MNVIVDSPLDAFAFNPVNLTPLLTSIINNLWAACVALIMAGAFSFWRLRSVTTKPPSQNVIVVATTPPPQTTLQKQNDDIKVDAGDDQEEEGEEGGLMRRSNSKKLFTVYYEEREIGASVDNDDDEEAMDGGDEDCVMIKRWGSSEELTVEMDLGWYSYQDRKVINGSVVKLWECQSSGEKDGKFSPRCDRNASFKRIRCSSPVGVTQLVL